MLTSPDALTRENSVPCRGFHPMTYRPKVWTQDGLCSRCRNRFDAEREAKILAAEAKDRALELAESMDDGR